ncbi:hypothetical protein FIBSPDRAFT_733519 [Athelia psychrophila]|uniref:Uncharacterized protein n=1 Tax=Athelia psychrophila TaxID=1759441 RepID=A0A166P5A9_9AGAM|nr:hypothetical protein FIBSPDRAFT_733519 [Fibularhizoctonia sp. CBS 109695]
MYNIQSERLSMETNSWMFVAAQHPNANGQLIHYTSPRLRRDAREDTVAFVQQFSVIINGLVHARRKDALEMGKALETSRREVVEKAALVQSQGEEIRSKDDLISKYKAILGLTAE